MIIYYNIIGIIHYNRDHLSVVKSPNTLPEKNRAEIIRPVSLVAFDHRPAEMRWPRWTKYLAGAA
jgi:hypothetical protein